MDQIAVSHDGAVAVAGDAVFKAAGVEHGVDVSGEVVGKRKDRLLTFDIPSGAWSVFCVHITKKNGEEAAKDYLNPLVKEAVQVLIDEAYEPHYQHYGAEFGKTIQGFFSDEPRFGNGKGTECRIGCPDMVLPWRTGLEKELGFEPKYLPLLWAEAEGMEKQIRFRYMDVITNLYRENFTEVLGSWCQNHGVWYLGYTIEDNGAHARLGYGTGHFFRGQKDMDFSGIDVIGGQIVPGILYHHDAFNTGGSNGEFYHYALAKLGTSAAHLDPRKKGRTMCEAFGAYGWNEGLKMIKWIAGHPMVRGVNYLVPYAYSPKKFLDPDCAPHFYAHGHNPQFRYFKVFSDYVNRTIALFQNGKHPARTGLFYPAEMEWAGKYMPVEKPARELTIHQISFDIVSGDHLDTAVVEKGRYTINGQSMEVLVVPFGEALPADTAARLVEMQNNGVKIIYLEERPKVLLGRPSEVLSKEFVQTGMELLLEDLGDTLISHYEVPFGLTKKSDSWASREMIDYYLNYCKAFFTRYKGKVKYWLTFNEINSSIAPMGALLNQGILNDLEHPVEFRNQPDRPAQRFQGLHHMFVASAQAVKMAHEIDPAYKVGNMMIYAAAYPLSARPEDVLACQRYNQIVNYFCSDVQCRGGISFLYGFLF